MRSFICLAVTYATFLATEQVPLPTNVTRSLDQAIAQTLVHNCTSLVLATSRLRADIAVQVMRYVSQPSLSILINSPIERPELYHALLRECKRGAHAVLFYSPGGGRGGIFDLLSSNRYFLPQLTLVYFTSPGAAGKPCDSMRQLHYPSVALKDEEVELCKGRYRLPETELWSGLRHRAIVIACGGGPRFCDAKFDAVIIGALNFLNASVTLQKGGMFAVQATKTEVEFGSADVTFSYEMLDEESLSDFHISPLLIEKRVIFYAHVRHARVETPTGSQHLSRNLLVIIHVTAAVFGFFLAVAAIAMMTERFLHEPGSGLVEVFLSIALWKSYNMRRDKFSSHTRRLLFSFWSLSCVCVVVYVQSVLTSAVILPSKQTAVLSFQSLCDAVRKESLCRCGTQAALVYSRRLPTWNALTKSLVKGNRRRTDCQFYISAQNCPQKVREDSHVGFAIADHDRPCQGLFGDELILGQKALGTILTGSFVRKGYPLASHYHSLVRRHIETGLFSRLQPPRQSPCTDKRYPEEFLSWYAPFVACIAGCALSTFVCVGEIMMSRAKKQCCRKFCSLVKDIRTLVFTKRRLY